MAWILARVLWHESTTTIPHLALYILYYSIQGKGIFYWSKIIATEISLQLSNFRKDKKFYMPAYLIFTIVYYHVFEGLHLSKKINYKIDLIHTWYHALWKQKSNVPFLWSLWFISIFFQKVMFGNNTSRLSLEETTFLDKRGNFEKNEHYSIIRVYCSREAPFYLRFYILDKIFMIEVCRQYRFWDNFFYERKKRKSIPLLWKFGEITLRSDPKIDEFSSNSTNIIYNWKIKSRGLNLNNISWIIWSM